MIAQSEKANGDFAPSKQTLLITRSRGINFITGSADLSYTETPDRDTVVMRSDPRISARATIAKRYPNDKVRVVKRLGKVLWLGRFHPVSRLEARPHTTGLR